MLSVLFYCARVEVSVNYLTFCDPPGNATIGVQVQALLYRASWQWQL